MNPLLNTNIAKLNARIREIAQKNSRSEKEITLLAVSKTRSALDIRQAFAGGLTHIGENYLQEAIEKQAELQDLPLSWHFIGPIQSNKTAAIAARFDWVHSIDRLKIARRLNDQRPKDLRPLQCCIQVNIGADQTKSGISLDKLPLLTDQIAELTNIELRGLMVIPKFSMEPEQQRKPFRQLADALTQLKEKWPALDTLSMGMSVDMDSAIAENTTILRIGTALFGPRNR
tara:strand:+ start:728 stop:1417 length:690 start_codon:yes stop_codon:yes gene_type:complete